MDESLQGALFLLAQIQGNSAIMASLPGGVHLIQAPGGAPLPFCVVTPMGGHDVKGVAVVRLFYEGTYQVRLWGYATQSDALQSTGDAIDALLQPNRQASSGNTASAHIMNCNRDNPLPMLPDWDGQALRIGIGGLYRLQVRQLP
jgi:hypothetical protein